MRNDVIAALNHFPRRFRKARLVAIDQRNAPGADHMKKQASKKQQRVIGTDFPRVLAIYRS